MTLVYGTGVIYDHHLRSSKYVYNTGHRCHDAQHNDIKHNNPWQNIIMLHSEWPNVCREILRLVYFFVWGGHAGAVSLSQGVIILAELACPCMILFFVYIRNKLSLSDIGITKRDRGQLLRFVQFFGWVALSLTPFHFWPEVVSTTS